MSRPEDWPERLAAFFEARGATPFAWGSNDCVTFAAGWLRELSGIDVLAGIGPWADEAEAEALLAERGGLVAAAEAALAGAGIPEIAPELAGRGDIVLLRAGNDEPLGICAGPRCAVAGPDGVLFLPRAMILRAWRP